MKEKTSTSSWREKLSLIVCSFSWKMFFLENRCRKAKRGRKGMMSAHENKQRGRKLMFTETGKKTRLSLCFPSEIFCIFQPETTARCCMRETCITSKWWSRRRRERKKKMMEKLTYGWSGWDVIYGTDAFRINFPSGACETPVYMRQPTIEFSRQTRKSINCWKNCRKTWLKSNDFLMSVSFSDALTRLDVLQRWWIMNRFLLYHHAKRCPAAMEIEFASDWLSSEPPLHMMGFKFLIFQPSTWQMMIFAINSLAPDRAISTDELNIIADINTVTDSERDKKIFYVILNLREWIANCK